MPAVWAYLCLFGAYLVQRNDKGEPCLIACASRTLNPTEKYYSVFGQWFGPLGNGVRQGKESLLNGLCVCKYSITL